MPPPPPSFLAHIPIAEPPCARVSERRPDAEVCPRLQALRCAHRRRAETAACRRDGWEGSRGAFQDGTKADGAALMKGRSRRAGGDGDMERDDQ